VRRVGWANTAVGAAYHSRLTASLPRIQRPSFRSMAGRRVTRSWWRESTKEKRPGHDPGRLLFAHRKEVVAMKQLRLNVAVTVGRFSFRSSIRAGSGVWRCQLNVHRAAAQEVAAQPRAHNPAVKFRFYFTPGVKKDSDSGWWIVGRTRVGTSGEKADKTRPGNEKRKYGVSRAGRTRRGMGCKAQGSELVESPFSNGTRGIPALSDRRKELCTHSWPPEGSATRRYLSLE